MSESAAPPFELSLPGKVFLLGEYAVLAGLPALLTTIGPRFRLRVTPSSGSEFRHSFHPDSPAGRWLARSSASANFDLHWEDPWKGSGGFGASTAQFALTHAALSALAGSDALDCHSIWNDYRAIHRGLEGPLPSGADLAVQITGGSAIFWPTAEEAPRCEDITEALRPFSFLVFSAAHQPGRKVATHDHLMRLAREGFPDHHSAFLSELRRIIEQAMGALDTSDPIGFAGALNDYADALAWAELEIPETRADRSALAGLPGVLGVKGTGALQADAIVVQMDFSASDSRLLADTVVSAAGERNLRLVARITQDGEPEAGLRFS